jgi:hypothetical protein
MSFIEDAVSTDVGRIVGQKQGFRKTDRATGHSNFGFLNDFLNGLSLSSYHRALLRVFSLARKHDYQSVLIDEIDSNDSAFLTEENRELVRIRPDFIESKVFKFSFFSVDNEETIDTGSFLGYAVFKVDYYKNDLPIGYVFEAILPPPRGHDQNNFVHCKRSYRVANSLGSNFVVAGTLYAQQSQHSFVCAHVALRTALSCLLPEGDITYQQIADLAGSRTGLEPSEIAKVLDGVKVSHQQLSYEPGDPDSISDDFDFMKTMYGFTESACPALLGFTTSNSRHIVPVLGHTFNEDSWVPPSNRGYFGSTFYYYPSEQWLSSHVMHDDNFGPYYCVPKHFITHRNFRVLFGISLDDLSLRSDKAEALALGFLYQIANAIPQQNEQENMWFNMFRVYARLYSLILRPTFIDKRQYLNHLKTTLDLVKNIEIEADIFHIFERTLPDKFWMIEASCPELFSVTRRKFGEVILFPSQGKAKIDQDSIGMVRLPGMIAFNATPQWVVQPTAIKEHTRLFSAFG